MICPVTDAVVGYIAEIRKRKALLSIDKHYTDVILPDFDLKRFLLKVSTW